MVIDKVLNGKYLQERSKTKLLIAIVPFPLLIVLTWLIAVFVGHHLLLEFIGMGVISILLMAPLIVFQQDELATVFCIVVHLYVDWYLRVAFIGIALTLLLLAVLFLRRSPQKLWIGPRAWGIWLVLFVLALFRTVHAPSFAYGADYYVNIFLIALLAFWLGTIIAKDRATIRRFFGGLSVLGALLAIHTIIQVATGHFLFLIPTYESHSSVLSYFSLTSPGIHRPESFLLNADTNGNFFAILLFVPLSLFITSTSSFAKGFYLSAMLLMAAALFLTYTTGALLADCAGLLIFILLVGRARHRIQILLAIAVALLILIVGFRSQLHLLYTHAVNPAESATRVAAWQTGIAVIKAYPLTGLGIGRDVYLVGAEPYRVPAQHIPLSHPHNSLIELAALGGLPLAFVFTLLLVIFFWQALQTWIRADALTRSVLAGGIAGVVALSCASLVNAGWTLAPLAMIGWLLLGIVSSPLLALNLKPRGAKEGA